LASGVRSLALREVTRACRFFPTPADIRAQIDQAGAKGLELEGEQARQQLMTWVRRYVLPDIGIAREAPPLPSAVEHAAKAAGDVFYLERCSEEELGWRKREFVRDWKTIHQTRQVEHLLSDGRAKRILAELAGPAERKRLPAPQDSEPQASGPEPSDQEMRAGFAALREKLAARPAVAHQVLNEEQWERRRAEQLARLRITHPDLDLGKRSRRRRRPCSQCGSMGLVSDGVSGSGVRSRKLQGFCAQMCPTFGRRI